jgi:ectoine hydroxylase-related dioxygenase (phytanoyl-CoA dioxygenase family)
MSAVVTLESTASLGEILSVMERDGAVIVANLLSNDLVQRLRADLDTVTQNMHAGTRSGDPIVAKFWGTNTKRFGRLAQRSPAFIEVLTHPLMTAISNELLLGNAVDWWLNSAQMMVIGPGENAQVLHRDVNNWPFFETPESPEVTVSWMLALGEFTKENGATNVVPGSHLWSDFSDRSCDHLVEHAEMAPGSGLLYAGRTLHGGGANTSVDNWRMGMHVSHVVGWLTPEEALPIANPWEIVRKFSPEVQRRLGWRCYEADSVNSGRLWTIDYEDVVLGMGLDESEPHEIA